MRPELHLRRKLGSLPVGAKVPVGQLARLLNASQAVVLDWLQWLVDKGMIDRETLRPVAPAAEPNAWGLAPAEPAAQAEPVSDFDRQLERVRKGEVGIGPAFHPRRADPPMTLGGVAGDIL